MSKTKFAIQLIIGFLPIVALWCIGWYFGDIFNESDQEFYVVVIVLSIILYSAIKTKKNKQYSER